MMKKIYIMLLVLVAACSAKAGVLPQDPRLVSGTLANGLKYYIYPNDYPKGEAVFRLFIRSGSVFEEDSQSGLAHFLEHMAFNGTTHFPGTSLVKFLESKGAKFGKDLNAHTSFNETVYKLQLPSSNPAFVDTVLTILSDWAGGLTLDNQEMEQERGVIFSEWLSKAGPEKDAQNAFLMDILNGSKYASRIVIGDTAVVLHAPRERLYNFYKNWYHPSRMAVAVAGDVDVKHTESTIRRLFGAMECPPPPTAILPEIPEYDSIRAQVMVHPSLSTIELSGTQLLPLLPPVSTTESYPLYLQQTLLNRLMKARFQRLSFDNPPYKSASASLSGFLNAKNLLMTSVELVPDKVKEGMKVFNEQLDQLFRYGFISLEIEKEKKSYLSALERSMKSKNPVQSASYMDQLYSLFYRGDALMTSAQEYKLAKKYLSSIDSSSLVNYLHATVRPDKTHYLLTAFGDSTQLPTASQLVTDAKARMGRVVAPYSNALVIPDRLLEKTPQPGRIVKQEKIQAIHADKLTLSNGATVIFRRSETKKSQLTLSGFRTGGLYAIDSTDFVTGLYTDGIVSLSGAGAFSREALSHFLAGNSASVRFLIDRTRSGLAGAANLTDQETLFQLLYLKWTQPRVDAAFFEQTKSKAIEAWRTDNRTPAKEFQKELAHVLQGWNYTNREVTDSVIAGSLKMDRLLPVFQSLYGSAQGYTFIITADCEVKELFPLIKKYLAALPSGPAETSYRFKGEKTPEKGSELIRKNDDNPRATVMLVFQKDDAATDYQAGSLRADVLQSVLRSRLLSVLREQMGMIYSVSVSASSTRSPSPLNRVMISFSCKPENVEKLIDSTRAVIRNTASQPALVSRELNDVKTNLIKEMQLNIQKDSYWSTAIRNNLFNGDNDWEFTSQYAQQVAKVNEEVLAGEIRRWLLNASMIKAVLYPKQ